MVRLRHAAILLGAMIAPLAALALSSARQDYIDATAARPDVDHGAQVFASCAGCHGVDGSGRADGNIPRVAGQYSRVLIRELVDYRYAKRTDPRMQDMADKHLLPDAQAIADVAAFVASLEPRGPTGTGPGANLELGRQIYLARCSSCHGRAGEGDEPALVPRLGGQHYSYLLRQLHDAIEGRRPHLQQTHAGLLKDLDADGLQGMADVLSRATNPATGTSRAR